MQLLHSSNVNIGKEFRHDIRCRKCLAVCDIDALDYSALFFGSFIQAEKRVCQGVLLYGHSNSGYYNFGVDAGFCRYYSFRKRLVGYI